MSLRLKVYGFPTRLASLQKDMGVSKSMGPAHMSPNTMILLFETGKRTLNLQKSQISENQLRHITCNEPECLVFRVSGMLMLVSGQVACS